MALKASLRRFCEAYLLSTLGNGSPEYAGILTACLSFIARVMVGRLACSTPCNFSSSWSSSWLWAAVDDSLEKAVFCSTC